MKITIIGAGAMGGAMADGLLGAGVFKPQDMTIADPSAAVTDKFRLKGLNTTRDNKAAVCGADIVAVVVKPWLVENVLNEIKSTMLYDRQMLIVIAAGVKSDSIKGWLSKDDGGTLPPLFLVIPNTAIAVKSSMTFIVPFNAGEEQTAKVVRMFNAVGSTLVIDERLLAAGTTLASCGIAYAMRYIRASVEGGVEIGFRAAEAQAIVLQTVKGAVNLLQQSEHGHPEVEIDKVTTPGGVTIRGLNEMEHAGFTSAVIRGLKAGIK